MNIVERLNDDSQCFCSIRKEAADEIERLREALRIAADRLEQEGARDLFVDEARSALQQKESK